MNDSISIIIPAYNEEKSLKDAVKVVSDIISKTVKEYEIIIINDGSTDTTGLIAKNLVSKNSRIKLITHSKNEGFGTTFKDGLKIATKKFVTGFPADNDMYPETFEDIIHARHKDKIILTYMSDMSQRSIKRRMITYLYTFIMNIIFGLQLKYYNGYFICSRNLVANLDFKSTGFTLFAELKIKLIKGGIPYIEIPYECAPRLFGTSKALTTKSIIQTFTMIPILILDTYFMRSKGR